MLYIFILSYKTHYLHIMRAYHTQAFMFDKCLSFKSVV